MSCLATGGSSNVKCFIFLFSIKSSKIDLFWEYRPSLHELKGCLWSIQWYSSCNMSAPAWTDMQWSCYFYFCLSNSCMQWPVIFSALQTRHRCFGCWLWHANDRKISSTFSQWFCWVRVSLVCECCQWGINSTAFVWELPRLWSKTIFQH